MSDKKFDLGDYVEVKDRIAILYELYPQARLVTDEVTILTAPDDKQRVMVKALAYRTLDDPHPGVGFSWMELPGTTSYTKGSELENTETSAWGRAIASLGILIDKSIASGQEVQNKQAQRPVGQHDTPPDRPELDRPVDGLIGIAEVGKARDSDFELRETPDGWALGFRLTQGRKGFKVLTLDALAQAIATLRPTIEGQRVTVWGSMVDEAFDKRDADGKVQTITYKVVHAERIATADFILPAPDVDGAPLTNDEKAAIGGGLPG